jgi:hypothetical protein
VLFQIISAKKKQNAPGRSSDSFDSIDKQTIMDYCVNNDADFAIVPKVKYFKVGLENMYFPIRWW